MSKQTGSLQAVVYNAMPFDKDISIYDLMIVLGAQHPKPIRQALCRLARSGDTRSIFRSRDLDRNTWRRITREYFGEAETRKEEEQLPLPGMEPAPCEEWSEGSDMILKGIEKMEKATAKIRAENAELRGRLAQLRKLSEV